MTALKISPNSAIVAAHPDDEVLWFSSIFNDVGKTVLCFGDVPSRPDWSRGRAASLKNYPKKNMVSLGLTESEVFAGAAWPEPVSADYGLVVKRSSRSPAGFSAERYVRNFEQLRQRLRTELKGCDDVFTHNPWGEYGHEEHVQVFRAVDSIRKELGIRLWFSNYFSNKSHGLMLRYMSGLDSGQITFKTNPRIGKRLQALYSRHGCWTWYADYVWPDAEAFIPWNGAAGMPMRGGSVIPMNAVRVEFPPKADTRPVWRRWAARVRRKASAVVPRRVSH